MKIEKIGIKGINLIKEFENFKAVPYLCPANIPTIGYGTTFYPSGERVKLSDKIITERTAHEFLMLNLKHYETAVEKLTVDTINQNQFDALVSFTYNTGVESLKKSTLLKIINKNKDNPIIVEQFYKWIYCNGKVLLGLRRRRKAEAKLYFE